MGMHHGVLVADLPWSTLAAELERHVGDLRDLGSLPADEPLEPEARDDGFLLIGGELAGRSYLLDASFLFSGMAPDLIAEIAAAQGALVAACLAETVSGIFALVVARGTGVLRHHFNSHTELTRPYDTGDPLPTERRQPLEDLDGIGLQAAIKHLGFDADAWERAGSHRKVLFIAERLPRSGALAAAVGSHQARFGIPKTQQPSDVVTLARRDGGFDITRSPYLRRLGKVVSVRRE